MAQTPPASRTELGHTAPRLRHCAVPLFNDGDKCPCCLETIRDKFGQHLLLCQERAFAPKASERSQRHRRLVGLVSAMLRRAKRNPRVECTYREFLRQERHPLEVGSAKDSQLRDIKTDIIALGGRGEFNFIDVTVTGGRQDMDNDSYRRKTHERKIRQYTPVVANEPNGAVIVPLSFHALGGFHQFAHHCLMTLVKAQSCGSEWAEEFQTRTQMGRLANALAVSVSEQVQLAWTFNQADKDKRMESERARQEERRSMWHEQVENKKLRLPVEMLEEVKAMEADMKEWMPLEKNYEM